MVRTGWLDGGILGKFWILGFGIDMRAAQEVRSEVQEI